MEKKRKPRGRRQCRIVSRRPPGPEITDRLEALTLALPKPTAPALEDMLAAMAHKENAAG